MKIHIVLNYLIKYNYILYLIKFSTLVYIKMETFSPEDILVDNLSFKLNKGASYITDRRSVRFYPSGSNVYRPTSGNRVLKFSLNAEDNAWLDPQSVRVCFTVQNLDQDFGRKLRPLSPPYSFFRRMRIIAGNQVVEDFDNYNRVHHMFSKLMSQGARKDEANEGFGYRYDDEVKTLVNNVGTQLDYEVNANNCKGFKNQMTVCFKPLAGLFTSNFKYLPLKYMGNLTIELELVSNDLDCIINPDDYDETDTGIPELLRGRFTHDIALPAGNSTNTSKTFELNNAFVACDICTLDNSLNNEYVKHLLEGKGLPITYTTYITQSQSVEGKNDISVPVIRCVSKLVASFVTFYRTDDPSLGYEYANKRFCRFYHPHQAHDSVAEGIYDINKDLEFQIQLGSKLYPEYPCNSLTQCFYHLRKALNLPVFHQHSISIDFKQYRDRQFVFGFDFQKLQDSGWTGINTRAGQQMLIRIKPAGASIPVDEMPDELFVTLLSEQILEIRDLGLKVFD